MVLCVRDMQLSKYIAVTSPEVEDYLSLIVANPIAASIAPISQNRTTTCVSVHPLR